MKKIYGYFALLFFIMLILFADTAKQGAEQGLNLAFSTAIPALFPFFVASTMLSETGMIKKIGYIFGGFMQKIYGFPKQCAGVLVLGLTGGYPVGVSAVAELYEKDDITKKQAEMLLGFCNNTGPAFIVGVCGVGLFRSVKFGVILYFIHIISALICGLFFKQKQIKSEKITENHNNTDFSKAIVISCEKSAQTSIKVAAFLTFFSVLTAILNETGLFELLYNAFNPLFEIINMPADILYPLFYGFFELTKGLCVLNDIYVPTWLMLCITSAMLAFGGLSVMCQSMSIAGAYGLSIKFCIIGKILHMIFAFIVTFIFSAFLPQRITVMAGGLMLPTLAHKYTILVTIWILFILTTGKCKKNKL